MDLADGIVALEGTFLEQTQKRPHVAATVFDNAHIGAGKSRAYAGREFVVGPGQRDEEREAERPRAQQLLDLVPQLDVMQMQHHRDAPVQLVCRRVVEGGTGGPAAEQLRMRGDIGAVEGQPAVPRRAERLAVGPRLVFRAFRKNRDIAEMQQRMTQRREILPRLRDEPVAQADRFDHRVVDHRPQRRAVAARRDEIIEIGAYGKKEVFHRRIVPRQRHAHVAALKRRLRRPQAMQIGRSQKVIGPFENGHLLQPPLRIGSTSRKSGNFPISRIALYSSSF